jgi:acyl-CoA synthetase (NDP forming)
MPVSVLESDVPNALEIHCSGKLTKADYDEIVPKFEQHLARQGKPRVLVEMRDFEGWEDTTSLWEDLKMDTKHINDVKRLAIVGDAKWHDWLTKLTRPFTTADVEFFPPEKIDEARAWLRRE